MTDSTFSAPRRLGALIALALIAFACAPADSRAAETVVSLTFDDGAKSQLFAKDEMAKRGLRGTFNINSGLVGSNSYYMTWSEIATVAGAGNEVAGHTLMDKGLVTGITDPDERRQAVCQDRQNLIAHGYEPVSFAYPHGQYNASIQALVHECGYSSARRVGGLKDSDCTNCPTADTIPPADPYAVRSNSALPEPFSLDDLEHYVTQAEDNGGGWVVLTFHDFCPCPPGSVDGSVSKEDFVSFLDWLPTSGAVVKTVRSVMGFPDFPTPPAETPQPVHAFSAAPDRVTAFASLQARKRQDVDKLYVSAAMIEHGMLSATGSVNVPNASRVFKLKRSLATATPGKRVKLRLKLSKKGLRAAKRAIRAHRRVRATITITAADRAGNRKTAKRTIRLRD